MEIMNKKIILIFVMPLIWLILLGMTEISQHAEWGYGGHPSNRLALAIIFTIFSPLSGLIGIGFSVFLKTYNNTKYKVVSILLNILFIIIGAGLSMWWFR